MVPVPFSSDTFYGNYGRFKSDGSFQNSEATSENAQITMQNVHYLFVLY